MFGDTLVIQTPKITDFVRGCITLSKSSSSASLSRGYVKVTDATDATRAGLKSSVICTVSRLIEKEGSVYRTTE